MTLRTCDNCERTIGHLEAEFALDEHQLCRECYERLRPDRPVPADRPETDSQPPLVVPPLAAVRPPKRPWIFWAAIGFFLAGSVLVGLEMMKEVHRLTYSMETSLDTLMQRLSELRSKSALASSTLAVIGMVLSLAHVIGFVAGWRGYLTGALVMVATGVALTVMEFSGVPMTGLKPTGLYVAGIALGYVGFICFLSPPAWEYYRRSHQYRRGESYK
jgi:hypothetical protein